LIDNKDKLSKNSIREILCRHTEKNGRGRGGAAREKLSFLKVKRRRFKKKCKTKLWQKFKQKLKQNAS